MKATIWFVVGIVLMAISLFGWIGGAIVRESLTLTFNITAITSFIGALVCYHMGQRNQ